MVCKRAIISGKVQGVGFRYHTAEKASTLNLRGYVRNLEDGRVEIIAAGDSASIDELIQWAKIGPPQAVVSSVDVTDCDCDGSLKKFHILR